MSKGPTRREFIQGTITGATGIAALGALGKADPPPGKVASTLVRAASDSGAAAGASGKRFEMPIRYVPWTVNYEDEFPEDKFAPIERRVGFDPELSALILLDVWSWHFMPTYRERAGLITRERIKPVAEACRKAGVLVVHAPSPPVANKYPEHRFWPASEWKRQPMYSPPGEAPGWPAPEMASRTGRFKEYSQKSSPDAPRLTEEQLYRKYNIHPAVGPEPNDLVVATREELHGLLAKHKRFHLFYAGFVSNGCILERDYGTRQMAYLGYQIILLRDCTTGLETSETIGTFEQTKASVHNLEFWFSTSTSGAMLDGLGKIA